MKHAVAIGVFVFLVHLLALGTSRVTLLLMLVVGSSVLIRMARRRPQRFWKYLVTTSVLTGLLAIVPVDIRLERTSSLRPRLLPVVWGYPTPETFERAMRGDVFAGGCILPLNPAAYVVTVPF
jgi:hypothetical protein